MQDLLDITFSKFILSERAGHKLRNVKGGGVWNMLRLYGKTTQSYLVKKKSEKTMDQNYPKLSDIPVIKETFNEVT